MAGNVWTFEHVADAGNFDAVRFNEIRCATTLPDLCDFIGVLVTKSTARSADGGNFMAAVYERNESAEFGVEKGFFAAVTTNLFDGERNSSDFLYRTMFCGCARS